MLPDPENAIRVMTVLINPDFIVLQLLQHRPYFCRVRCMDGAALQEGLHPRYEISLAQPVLTTIVRVAVDKGDRPNGDVFRVWIGRYQSDQHVIDGPANARDVD